MAGGKAPGGGATGHQSRPPNDAGKVGPEGQPTKKDVWKWAIGKWCRIHQKWGPWRAGTFDSGPFYAPGSNPYVQRDAKGPSRAPRRKFGRNRVENNPNPSYLIALSIGQVVSTHMVNYKNKPGKRNRMAGGIKQFICKMVRALKRHPVSTPTFNDMMRMGESNTGPDMTRLMDMSGESPMGE